MSVRDSISDSVPVEEYGARFVMTIDQAEQQVRQLQEFIKRVMQENEDYGKIPGCPKPTLLKPGAEKLCEIYGLAPHVEIKGRIEDWDKGFFHYGVRVSLISKRSGQPVAQGVGWANSRGKRYRKQDSYTLVNTVLKMAKKRALVDAALSATRSSGIFTQDMEDLGDMGSGESAPPKAQDPSKEIKRLFGMLKGDPADPKYGASNKGPDGRGGPRPGDGCGGQGRQASERFFLLKRSKALYSTASGRLSAGKLQERAAGAVGCGGVCGG